MARFYGVRVVDTGRFECTCPFYRISPKSRLDLPISWVLTRIEIDDPDRPRAPVCVYPRVARSVARAWRAMARRLSLRQG
eukprot:COSAG02_NODE_3374_length_6847_cov_15.475697_1_plen_80_part_00